MPDFRPPSSPKPSVVRVATLSESEMGELLQEAARRGAEQALASAALPAEDWLTLREAADVLGISEGTLRKRALDKSVKAYRIGRLWRFRRSEL